LALQRGSLEISGLFLDFSTVGLIRKKINGDFSLSNLRYQSETIQSSCSISGNSNMSIDPQGVPSDGTFNFELKNLMIRGLVIQGFNIPALQVKSSKCHATIRNRTLTINDFVIEGSELNGLIRGTIILDPVFERSQLSLTIEISGNSTILSDLKPLLSMFINTSTGRLTLSVQGPLINPTANLVTPQSQLTLPAQQTQPLQQSGQPQRQPASGDVIPTIQIKR
jgi:hypothetical protein